MPLLLVLVFVAVPVLELYVIVQVGQQIGVLPTIALLVLSSVVGAWLVRREGRRAWAALREAIAAHRVPTKEVADGALVVFGGALLLTPGFSTDALGLLCVLPVTRAVVRRLLTTVVASRLGVGGLVGGLAADQASKAYRRRASGPTSRPGRVVEGEVVDGEVVDGEVVDGPGTDPRAGGSGQP